MAADTNVVEFEQHDAVGLIALNRPDKYNAVNNDMHAGLRAAIRKVQRDASIRAVVITGRGNGFCSGQDLTEFGMAGDDFRVDDHVRATFNPLVMSLRNLDRPVIAAVNGVAAGAGASLALAADLRICSDRAKFLQAFIRIGLVPDTGATWFLPHLVGVSRALELAWTGRPVEAEEAVRIGMANEVVPHDDVLARSMDRARELAELPTRAIAMMKRAIYRSLTVELDDALEYEAQLQQAAAQTNDHREGVMAFLEKREPAFSGS